MRCDYVRNPANGCAGESVIDWTAFFYCTLDSDNPFQIGFGVVVCLLVLLYLFLVLSLAADRL